MWYATPILTAGVLGITFTYAARRRTRGSLHARISSIRNIKQVLSVIQHAARRSPTDDVMLKITECIRQNGIPEKNVIILSRLHTVWGGDDGSYGYAINMLWSCVVQAYQDDEWIVI
jgi:hypothetical protein